MLPSNTKFFLKPQGICVLLFPYAPNLKGETSKAHLHGIQRVDCRWGMYKSPSGNYCNRKFVMAGSNMESIVGLASRADWGGFLCNVRRAAAVGCWLWSTEDGNGCQGTVWRRVRSVVGEERLLHLALCQQHSIVSWPLTAQWLVLTVILLLTAGLWQSSWLWHGDGYF